MMEKDKEPYIRPVSGLDIIIDMVRLSDKFADVCNEHARQNDGKISPSNVVGAALNVAANASKEVWENGTEDDMSFTRNAVSQFNLLILSWDNQRKAREKNK